MSRLDSAPAPYQVVPHSPMLIDVVFYFGRKSCIACVIPTSPHYNKRGRCLYEIIVMPSGDSSTYLLSNEKSK